MFTYQNKSGQFFALTPEMAELPLTSSAPIGYYTILWMTMGEIMLGVDNLPVTLSSQQMTFFTPNQYVSLIGQEGEYIALRFNREFYCTHQNDHEVSCNGLIFYGSKGVPIVKLMGDDVRRFDMLYAVLQEEFSWRDGIQGEMLRVLLKRWIIMATRLYKMQDFTLHYDDPSIETIRHFNMLVEERFRELHTVAGYARLMHKSPKTLANLFRQNQQPSPLSIIHMRIALEAKRLLLHTNDAVAEVAYALGFDNTSSFSRLFKRETGHSPLQFRELHYK